MLRRRVCLGKCEVVKWSAGDIEDGGGACVREVVDCVRVLVVVL